MKKKSRFKELRSKEDIRFNKEYYKWRRAVFKRDRYKCQMPSCLGGCGQLQAHHIIPWSDSVHGRFLVNNGITLGWKCHKRISGYERLYAELFISIVRDNSK